MSYISVSITVICKNVTSLLKILAKTYSEVSNGDIKKQIALKDDTFEFLFCV